MSRDILENISLPEISCMNKDGGVLNQEVCSPTDKKILSKSPSSDEPTDVTTSPIYLCRICHDTGSLQGPSAMTSPCHCTGSMRYVHAHCLHSWLTTSRKNCCEICGYKFKIVRPVFRPFVDFLVDPRNQKIRSDMATDLLCLSVLTLFAVACLWLMWSGWTVPGVICLIISLFAIFDGSEKALKHHRKVWKTWKRHNQVVKIMDAFPK